MRDRPEIVDPPVSALEACTPSDGRTSASEHPSLYLIRTDGYVGFRCRAGDEAELVKYLQPLRHRVFHTGRGVGPVLLLVHNGHLNNGVVCSAGFNKMCLAVAPSLRWCQWRGGRRGQVGSSSMLGRRFLLLPWRIH